MGMSGPVLSKSFTRTNKILWTVNGIPNPEWGSPRSPRSYWDFDVTDSSIWENYAVWSSQFEFFVYNQSSKNVVARSWSNLSSGYIGLDDKSFQTLHVNSFDPATRANRILLYPGTETTDIKI
jgi:hypothetical protein